ncbi:hypothetical protein BGZ95_011745 [Linnemannia exigua]|uniref:Uncharacterized protein n=1 Tax=Linnemannia exigua TaxID=604196 RepID=A0AAD4H522_9FUNG|nr:hypothetical protein BGZ95_011745 [Linnemannia exigua]
MPRKPNSFVRDPSPSSTSGYLNSNNNTHKPSVFLTPSVCCYSTEGLIDNSSTPEVVNHYEQQQPFTQQAPAASYNSNNNGYENEDNGMATLEDQFSVMEINTPFAWLQDSYQGQQQQPQPPNGGASPCITANANSFAMVANTSSSTAFYTGNPMGPGFGSRFAAHPGYGHHNHH